MEKNINGKGTFVVNILDTQNASWQGTVMWANGKTSKPFRSALELMKLIDSALGKECEKTADESLD